MFTKTQLSIAVCAAIASMGMAGTATAQTDASGIEEVVITGIAGSLTRSIDIKKNSNLVSDSIAAEDLGKFPDNNIADSLQRVPGVAIDRAGGEGRYVSIRGLGPDFTQVLVNGRSVATENEERAFSFDTLASELISKVDVFKSSNATLKEGGLGGLVNVVTARPFDFNGLHVAGSVKGIYEENSEDTSPQGSLIVSNTFNDKKWGILGSLTYQKRSAAKYSVSNSHISNTEEEPFLEFIEPSLGWDGGYAYSGDSIEEDTFRLQEINRGITYEERERIGGNIAIQMQATDNLVLTADAIYSKYDTSTSQYYTGNYLWAPTLSPLNKVDGNGFYTTINHGYDAGYNISGYAHALETKERPTETLIGGFNANWQISDSLSMIADLSQSSSIMDNKGLDRVYTLEILDQPGILVTSNGGIPSIEYANATAVLPSEGNANQSKLRARQTSNYGVYVEADNTEAKVDFTWEPTDFALTKVNFGANYTEAKKTNEYWDTPNLIKRMYQKNAEKQVIDYESIVDGVINPGNVFGNLNGDVYKIDPVAYRNWMANNIDGRDKANTASGIATKAAFIANGSSWNAVKSGNSFEIQEDVSSAYIEAVKDTEIYDMPLSISAGVRYTSTELTSSGTSQVLVSLEPESTLPGEPESPNLVKNYSDEAGSPVAMQNKYDNWLPSINAKLTVTDDFMIRAAASQTLTRATLTSLAPQLIYGTTTKGTRVATGTNPELKPFLSTNIDVSFEYYYNDASLVALALFRKDVDDFIVDRSEPETFTNVEVPADHPEYQVFQVRRPHNGPSAVIEGAEFNWTHIFENGFGFTGNYTVVDSNATLGSAGGAETFALPGVSDTGNLTGFYQADKWEMRVAYNYRTAFLGRVFNGPSNEPVNVGAYGSVDISASYDILDNVTIFIEGSNVTGETVDKYGRYSNQFISFEDTGSLYTFGVRAKF
ncbi:MAG: TonB-dependent receptor [Cellvibrio sp.]|uniref:TonB-dependent receptor n=1 Tax=Cellvibrio sp. TaxID=1965322 RepID=UPI0031AB94D4